MNQNSTNNQRMAVIMSGGLALTANLPEHVLSRCDYFLANQDDFDIVVMSSSFSLNIRPKLNHSGGIISEASAGCAYLKKSGYRNQVLCEQFSHDTIGSVFFIFDFFAKAFNPKKITFITSDFHVSRVQLVADKIKQILDIRSFEVNVVGCISPHSNLGRAQRESDSIEKFNRNYEDVCCRADFLKILLQKHINYNCSYSGSELDEKDMLY